MAHGGKGSLKKVGKNMFECAFNSVKEKRRVLEGGPWLYDQALLVFEEIKGNERYSRLEFKFASFWIHFTDLPRVCLSRKWAERLGNAEGEFERLDLDKMETEWGDSLRVKVKIDVTKPLWRGTFIRIGSKGSPTSIMNVEEWDTWQKTARKKKR